MCKEKEFVDKASYNIIYVSLINIYMHIYDIVYL